MPKGRWRLLRLRMSSYARASVLINSLFKLKKEGKTPDTFALVTFEKPAVCLFYYNDPDKEVDLEFCHKHDIEVGRRDTGGSPYWMDPGTLLFFLLMERTNVKDFPDSIAECYALLIGASARALSSRFGINASYRPLNDLEVDGRKIAGHTLTIEGSTVRWAGGPQVLRPRLDLMSGALKPPPEKFADKEAKSVRERVTSLEDVLGKAPSMEDVEDCYTQAIQQALGVDLSPAGLQDLEERIFQRELTRGLSEDWLMAMSERRKFQGPLQPGVRRGEHLMKVPNGPLIRAVVLTDGDVIQNLSLTGSFHCSPVTIVEEMEGVLRGSKVDRKALMEAVSPFFQREGVQISSCSAEDFVETILNAVQKAL